MRQVRGQGLEPTAVWARNAIRKVGLALILIKFFTTRSLKDAHGCMIRAPRFPYASLRDSAM